MQKLREITLTEAEIKDALEVANNLVFIPKAVQDYVKGIVDGAVKVEEALRKQSRKGA